MPVKAKPCDPITIICELCDARIPTSRGNAKLDRFDHVEDEHHDVFFSIAERDRPNYLFRMFRITNRMGKPERLPI